MQACVVSLEPVRTTVDEPVEWRFARPGAGAPDDLAWDQDVEPLEGAELDVGEIFAEELVLALDPYPRAADAEALVSRELGPYISFGADGPSGRWLLRCWMRNRARRAPPRQAKVEDDGSTKEEGIEVEAQHAPLASSPADGQPDRMRELRRVQAAPPHLPGLRPLQRARSHRRRSRTASPPERSAPVTLDHRPRRDGRRSRAAGGDRGRRSGAGAQSGAALRAVRRPASGSTG